ncbi:MAG TPA: ABC transporter ATP-binding protein [Chryseolinea sp.]|nr:ABC transporter ATP-binding protein [Chryseolinea sp.]
MKPILEVHNIGKHYRIRHQTGGYLSLRDRLLDVLSTRNETHEEFWALRNVSFGVEPGESLGIIGRNGAGKSTLLKVLSRITPPTTGRFSARGRIASLLEVGTGFHPELSGRENVFFNGSLLGMKRREIEAKFDEIVDFSGVERFLDTPLKHYSSGMQLRLAFAVAAFLEPEILVVDEVLAVGDAEFQKKCLGKMEDVSRSGRTILFVSHNLGAIKNLCSRTILLDGGRVLMDGTVDAGLSAYLAPQNRKGDLSVYSRPQNAALWIGNASINRLSENIVLYYGEGMTIELSCMVLNPVEAYVGFVIVTSDGEQIVCANNRYLRTKFLLEPNRPNRLTCSLGSVPLMEGNYFVNLYLGDHVRDIHVVENALQFQVIARDIWGNGILPPQKAAKMWWPVEFNID